MKPVNENEYYKILDENSDHYKLNFSKIYKDCYGSWTLLALFVNDISDAFRDWSKNNFDLQESELLTTETYWKNLKKVWKDKKFDLVVFRGSINIYCLVKSLYGCVSEPLPDWKKDFILIHSDFKSKIV
jgi:hypothetical protein